MANFDEAFKLTGHNEGGYANNPNDHGGETYAGIARKFWPNWSGWLIIDDYKQKHSITGINTYLKSNAIIQSAIAHFYKLNFWDINKLDLIKDQQLANNVYDFGVNSGVGKAAKTLQKVIGVTQDGIIGPKTIAATNAGDAKAIYERYNEARKTFYNSLAMNPGQHQFLNSWMSRIKDYRTT